MTRSCCLSLLVGTCTCFFSRPSWNLELGLLPNYICTCTCTCVDGLKIAKSTRPRLQITRQFNFLAFFLVICLGFGSSYISCTCSAMMISIVMWDFRNHKNVVLVNTCSLISTSTSNTLMAIEQSNCQSIEWFVIITTANGMFVVSFQFAGIFRELLYSVQCPLQTCPLT